MLKTKNNIIKVGKKINHNIKLLIKKAKNKIVPFCKQSTISYQLFLKRHWKSFAIGFASLILLTGLGFGIYKYFTTPRAPDLKTADGGYIYKADGFDYTAFIGNKESNRPDVNFAVGKGSVVFTPASGNTSPTKPETNGDKAVIFKNVYQDIDFKYQTLPLGIKEEIIINKPSPIKTFPFFLDFKDVTPQYITENIKGTIFYDNDKNYLFNFEKPYAFDAKGERTDNIGLSIRKDSATGKYVAIVSLDDTWIDDPSRAYPITIDPTIVHDTSSEFSPGSFNRSIDFGATGQPNISTSNQEASADIHTVALWHMNEASGNVTDFSGNGYTGTPTGTTVVSGQTGFGNARKLNGSGDHISFGDVMNGINLPVTVEAWIYQSQYCDTTCTIFHSDDPDTDTGNYYGFSFATGTTGGLGAGFYNGVSAGPDGRRSIGSGNGVLPVGQWNHVAVTISGPNDVSFFVNGQQVTTAGYSGTGTTMVHNSNPARIGRNTRYGLTYFNGIIDEVRISDIARTPEEIALDAQKRPYSTYTSDVIDLSKVTSWNSISWTGTGFATGDGETATASATSNLIAQWNFNETSGTTASVATGSCGATCNGTLTNFASTGSQDAAAKTGWTSANRRWGAGALMFDGTNDYVSTGYQWNSSLPFTIEAWVNPSSEAAGDWQKVIASNRGTGVLPYFDIYLNTGSDYTGFGYSVWNDAGSSSWSVATGGSKDKAGKWYHVVGVYYPNDKIQLYVNGVLEKETTGLSGFSGTGGVMRFGIHNTAYGANTRWFDGIIDTSRVYSKALTASEVLSNYNLGRVELQTRVGDTTTPNDGTWEEWRPVTNETAVDALNGPYQYNTTDSGLVSYWPMDEASGTSVADVKGSNTGTATGASINDGQFARSRGMDGTNDTVSIANPSNFSFDRTSTFSIEAWVKKTNSTQSTIFSKMSNAAPYTGYEFAINASGQPYLLLVNTWSTNALYVISTNTVTDNQWHHVAVTYSGSSTPAGVILYIDGVATSTTTSLNSLSASITNAITPYIGSRNNSAFFFSGNIDEVRVYNSTLSSTTLKQHSDEGSTNADTFRPSTNTAIKMEGTGSERIQTGQMPVDAHTVGLWHMEETSGTGAYIKDSSPNANNGTPTGASLTEGFAGKARSFNGSSNYVSLPASSTFDLQTLSIEAWVYSSNFAQNGFVFEKTTNGVVNTQYSCFFETANGIVFRTYNTTPTSDNLYVTLASSGISNESWNHLACTYDGSTKNIYVNGILVASKSYSQTLQTNPAGTSIVGAYGSGTGYFFNGKIDEVRVSSIARSADTIAETYRAGRDHYLNKSISSTNLSSATKIPFYVASDRSGSYLSATIGESAYSNYQPDTNTVALWHMDEGRLADPYGLDSWWRMDDQNSSVVTTGGTVTYSGGYTIHTFTSSGTFTSTPSINAEVLVVAGGGGGGNDSYNSEGGGGAGGVQYTSSLSIGSGSTTITVGNGGAVNTGGGNSSIGSLLVSTGGGQGGVRSGQTMFAGNGGSGGGGSACCAAETYPGTGISGQGNAGGYGTGTVAGGGGGKGSVGGVPNGGSGTSYSISGSSVCYGGGGGGYPSGTATCGGGAYGNAGTANTGGGGGAGATGGSGIVIIRYLTPTTQDSTTNLNHGTLTGTTSTAGKFGNARSFNGTTDYMTSTNSLNYTSGSFSVSMWVKPSSLSNSPVIFSNGSYQVGGYYCHINSTGAVSCNTNQAGAIQTTNSTNSFVTGAWQLLTVARNGSSIRIYRNGQDVTSSAGTHIDPASTTEKFVIGTYGPSPSGWYYNGLVDDVRVYNRALSGIEIQTMYGAVKDSSGSGNHGTAFGTTGPTQGALGKARTFTNTNPEYVGAPDSASLDLTTAYTLEAWIYPKSASDWRAIINKGSFSSSYAMMLMANGGGIRCYTNNTNNLDTLTNIPNDRWTHVACVWDGTNKYVYVNGKLDNVGSWSGTLTNNSDPLTIGRDATNATYTFNGNIDEVRISNTARSAGQIRHTYEVGLRTHNITIDFKAKLEADGIIVLPIANSNDLSFPVDETVFGSSAKANHIFPGEKIIVKENYNGTEYIAQGTVATVNSSTGAITVTAWDSGSTFPASGFSTSTTVFKWQREYFDITGSLSAHRDATTLITLRMMDGSQGADIWLDDFRSSTGYLNTPAGSTITSSTGKRYAQYRTIISQNTPATLSPSLTSVSLDYTPNSAPNTPSLDTPSNAAVDQSLTPALKTTTTDTNSNNLQYKIMLCTTSEMTVGCQTFDQTSSQTGWSGQNADGNTTYTSGTQATYTIQSALTAGTTYYWKSYAIDPSGSNTWSSTQTTPYSFTTYRYPTAPTDLLTQGQTNPRDIKTLTPYFSAIYNNPDDVDVAYYQIQVSSSPDFSGSLMWDSGQVATLTGIAPGQRLTPNVTYTGSALSWSGSYYWRIKFWNSRGLEGPFSEVATFSLDSVATNCRVDESVNDSSMIISWTDGATSEAGFEVQRSVDGAAFAVLHTGLPANTVSDTDSTVSSGHTYQYRVAPYYTGPVYDSWCTTATLTLQLGEFSIKGLDLKGLDIR